MMEMTLEDRGKRVVEILSRWQELNVNDGWVSGFILRELDAGGHHLEEALARLRAEGTTIEETNFGRIGMTHYRLRKEEPQ